MLKLLAAVKKNKKITRFVDFSMKSALQLICKVINTMSLIALCYS